MSAPLTLGTAGHVDHGKTALVAALTGTDTDRLAEERERGISIVLGYAALELPSGRRLSVVDVPGHERFVRTMVSGATGIDLYLLVVAADDGVMPQTREHWTVLRALGVDAGVVAVAKADLTDPAAATEDARELVGDGPAIVACSARTGAGLDELLGALDAVAAGRPSRAADAGAAPVLHVDRAFTIRGAGTVVTGTLWSGALAVGDSVRLLPEAGTARIRTLHVHERAVQRAQAGQRVAVNLAGIDRVAADRCRVVAGQDAELAPAWIVEAALDLATEPAGGRVTVQHGTMATPARVVRLDGDRWQIRAREPLIARAGDRLVVRASSPPVTIGGGVVLDPRARRAREAAGEPAREPAPAARSEPPPLPDAALALEARLRAAGHEPPSERELGDEAAHLPALRAAGRAVRVGRSMHAHPEALAAVRARVQAILSAEGQITLARLRDELGTSRKYAQALLEHLDAERVTLRREDDRRVARRRS
jgi:selenocysteine-specific elongation factor